MAKKEDILSAEQQINDILESLSKMKKAADMLPENKRQLLNLGNLEKFDEIFMANLSPRKSPDNREEWMASWEKFKNA